MEEYGIRLVDTLLLQGFQIHTYRIVDMKSAVVTWQEGTDIKAADTALDKFDWSEEAHKQWLVTRNREAVLATLMSNDTISVSVRVFLRDLYTELNDIRGYLKLPRKLEPEILARIVPAVYEGMGEI